MTTISSTDICNCANEFSVVHKSTHRNSLNAEIIKNNNGSRSFDKNFLVDATDEICLQDIQEGQLTGCLEHNVDAEQNVDPLKEYLRDLWINIKLFWETDKWEPVVTLKVGDSHYPMRMDDIESRWRNPQI